MAVVAVVAVVVDMAVVVVVAVVVDMVVAVAVVAVAAEALVGSASRFSNHHR
ncbi:MAG: hypothetical protein ABID84_05930 [Chloroflexota bacterium]